MSAINTMQKPNIQGIHVNWTAPAYKNKYTPSRNFLSSDNYCLDDYEILTTILSIASWQKWYGPIHLYCDDIAAEYYEKLGILSLWDKIDTKLLASISPDINPESYFAAAKLWVQKTLTTPYCILDTDAYFTKSDYHFLDFDICFAHHELLNSLSGTSLTYPPIEQLHLHKDFQFAANYSFIQNPANVAFLYVNNERLRDYYTTEALHFIKTHTDQPTELSSKSYLYMVFAEQRLLAEIISYHNFKNTTLSDYIWSTSPEYVWLDPKTLQPAKNCQQGIHHTAIKIGALEHLWKAKKELKTDPDLRKKALKLLLNKLEQINPKLLQLAIVNSIQEQNLISS